jgi:outer membrane biosynthesis protein TonB
MTVASTAGDAAYWALAIFLVLLGVGSLIALVKLGRLFDRVSSFLRGTERDLLPVVVKTGGTVDRVNYQLDKLDTVTDSAVSMADSADTAVRAVSTAIAAPVEKVSGLAAGIAHGFSSLKKTRNVSEAMDAAKDAARRRQDDLAEDLRGAGPTPPTSERPAPTPPPPPEPKPDPWPKPPPTPKPDPAPIPPEELP